MKFTFNVYSALLLIFFVNGLIFSVLLFKKGVEQDNPPSKWLSLFVFLCCLYICPWMLGHASWYFNQPYRDILFYVPTQQLFLMGPVIYFYTQSLLNPSYHAKNTAFCAFCRPDTEGAIIRTNNRPRPHSTS